MWMHSLIGPILANADDNAAAGFLAFLAAMWMVFCGIGLLWLAFIIFNCFYLMGCLNALPPEHRKQQPGMVWLLLIPVFNIIWTFFVYPKISESFKSYFDSIGRTDVGDCGKSLSLAFCIIVCCMAIPYLNIGCALPISTVVLIVLLVKFSGLKAKIQKAPGATPATPLPPAA